MKRWQKITIALASSAALISLIAIVALISALPDPAAIGRALPATKNTSDSASTNSTKSAVPPLKREKSAAKIDRLGRAKTDRSTIANHEDPAERKRRTTAAFIDRYMGDGHIESRVCENLATASPQFKSAEEFGKQIEDSLLGEMAPSASVEAVMLPIAYTLKNEVVRELVHYAQEATARDDKNFLHKAEFYSLAARAAASVIGSRDELEKISAHAYRLHAMSRAVALNPELLQDPDLTDLCRRYERSATDGVAQDELADRERLSRVFERHGVSNESIGYDPNAATGVRVVQNKSTFQIKLPWLEQIFRKQ